MSELAPIPLPSLSMIEHWDKLDDKDVPIAETVPHSVPSGALFRYPMENVHKRVLSLKVDIPAVETVRYMQNFTEYVESVEEYLSEFYSARSLSKYVMEYISDNKREGEDLPPSLQGPEFVEVVKSLFEPRLRFLETVREHAMKVAKGVRECFDSNDFWMKGRYCDEFLELFCTLIHKCRALELLSSSKASFINDISNFSRWGDQETKIKAAGTRMWFNSSAITDEITRGLAGAQPGKGIKAETAAKIYRILMDYLKQKLGGCDFIIPEMQYAYVDTMYWLVQFYKSQRSCERKVMAEECMYRKRDSSKEAKKKEAKYKAMKKKRFLADLSDEDIIFIQDVVTKFRNVPEYMEFTTAMPTLEQSSLWKKVKVPMKKQVEKLKKEEKYFELNVPSMQKVLDQIRATSRATSNLVSNVATSVGIEKSDNDSKFDHIAVDYGRQICQTIPVVLGYIANAMNRIREELSKALFNPPKDVDAEDAGTKFELSMRYGLGENRAMFLTLLHLCRSLKEVIQTNITPVAKVLSIYVQNYIQEFIWGVLPLTLSRNQEHTAVIQIVKKMMVIFGKFSEDDYVNVNDKKKPGKARPKEYPKSPPHIAMLELLRTQVAYFTTGDSEFSTKKGTFGKTVLHETDQKEFKKFLDDSKYFIYMLRLPDILEEVCDQSSLFFKEFYLERDTVSFFPVSSSLPVVLSEFALNNYDKPELTSAIFFPLSIYDDAASAALRKLKSRCLYNEIKAEAKICLMSITRKISDMSFHPIRRFSSLRVLTSAITRDAAEGVDEDGGPKEGVSSIRLGVIVQQNQLTLLGCAIDTKTLIADRLNDVMKDEIGKIVQLTDQHGALASIAMSHLLMLLERTHEQFLSYGIPLMPFNDLVMLSMGTDTPNTFQSALLVNVCDHTVQKVLTQFSLLSNPNRLIPRKPVNIKMSEMFKGSTAQIFQTLIDPTMAFISVESFRALFWYLDDGAITMLHRNLLDALRDAFDSFTALYRAMKEALVRIGDPRYSVPCSQVFDTFDGAYRYFLEDQDVKDMLEYMSEIGNIIALSEMMDTAFMLKRHSQAITSSFFLNRRPEDEVVNGVETADFFTLFDATFTQTRSMFDNLTPMPTEEEITPPFTFSVIQTIASMVLGSGDLFDETSCDLTDLPSLTGFAAKWSVLDFIFCMLEVGGSGPGQGENLGSMKLYGEGVTACAAAIIAVTGQKPLHRAISINEKISKRVQTDAIGAQGQRLKRFMDVYNLVSSSFKCYITMIEPIVGMIVQTVK